MSSSPQAADSSRYLQALAVDVKPLLKSFISSLYATPTFKLRVAGSKIEFVIHQGVLLAKSEVLHSSISGMFKEGTEGVYEFKETQHHTLGYFMEWAYRGIYDVIGKPIEQAIKHLEVYIFAQVYQIPRLMGLSWRYLSKNLKEAGSNYVYGKNLKNFALPMLFLAFSSLPEKNELRQWLGKYTANHTIELQKNADFPDTLDKLAPIIATYVKPQVIGLWNSDGSPIHS